MRNNAIIALLTVFTLLAACTTADHKKVAPIAGKNHKIVKHFTCTMHPEISEDKPGICPKCGMELVEKNN